jgi:hypothetical protein
MVQPFVADEYAWMYAMGIRPYSEAQKIWMKCGRTSFKHMPEMDEVRLRGGALTNETAEAKKNENLTLCSAAW